MALHEQLPIHKTGVKLLTLAFQVQEQMPRGMKRILGEKIASHCVDMLNLMALANATFREERAEHIEELLKLHRTLTVLLRVGHDSRNINTPLWSASVELLGSIGSQAGGWLKSAKKQGA